MYISSKILFSSLQGLIFVVDSNDRERIGEANDELQKMVSKSIVTNLFRNFSLCSMLLCLCLV